MRLDQPNQLKIVRKSDFFKIFESQSAIFFPFPKTSFLSYQTLGNGSVILIACLYYFFRERILSKDISAVLYSNAAEGCVRIVRSKGM